MKTWANKIVLLMMMMRITCNNDDGELNPNYNLFIQQPQHPTNLAACHQVKVWRNVIRVLYFPFSLLRLLLQLPSRSNASNKFSTDKHFFHCAKGAFCAHSKISVQSCFGLLSHWLLLGGLHFNTWKFENILLLVGSWRIHQCMIFSIFTS